MRVWLIQVGEPLPIDGADERAMRTGMLAQQLVHAGHDVTWWSSSFDHVHKRHRVDADANVEFNSHLSLKMLRSSGYRRNISISRLRDHRGLARKFARQAGAETRPDVIVCSLPTLELCDEATEYGRRMNCPVVIDVRDLWPDVFLDAAPAFVRPIVSTAVWPLRRLAQRACRNATAIIGITEAFVDWGVEHAGRRRSPLDRVFPMAYSSRAPADVQIDEATRFWAGIGITSESAEFRVCFFGSVSRHAEIPTVIEAARRLTAAGKAVRFVICGVGPRFEDYKRQAQGCSAVTFPGWVDFPKIWTLMRMAHVGLVPFVSSSNYIGNIPNKPIEYLSAGLPIVSSLRGTLEELLDRHACGVTYRNGDPRSLAAAIESLILNPDVRRRMADSARRLYREKFVAETVYGELCNYLTHVATDRQAVAG